MYANTTETLTNHGTTPSADLSLISRNSTAYKLPLMQRNTTNNQPTATLTISPFNTHL
jgi:hypothetical protein